MFHFIDIFNLLLACVSSLYWKFFSASKQKVAVGEPTAITIQKGIAPYAASSLSYCGVGLPHSRFLGFELRVRNTKRKKKKKKKRRKKKVFKVLNKRNPVIILRFKVALLE